MRMYALLTLLASVMTASVVQAQNATSDSTAAAAVVSQFHAALSAGDSLAALGFLADDAVVLEAGGMETRAEYRSHHLAADIQFAQSVPSTAGPTHVRVQGGVAWAITASTTTGTFQGRAVNSVGAELMVLTLDAGVWRIRAIHWSSRRRSAP